MSIVTEVGMLLFVFGWPVAGVFIIAFIASKRRVSKTRKELDSSNQAAADLGESNYDTSRELAKALDQNEIYLKRICAYEGAMFGREVVMGERDVTIKKMGESIDALKSRLSHKNQPRDKKGFFLGAPEAKTNPDIGKYLCVNQRDKKNPVFTEGLKYARYNVASGNLVLIGNDRSRHVVEEYGHCFQLIAE